MNHGELEGEREEKRFTGGGVCWQRGRRRKQRRVGRRVFQSPQETAAIMGVSLLSMGREYSSSVLDEMKTS